MAVLDWIIVGLYLVIAVAIGVHFAKRAARSTTDYFLAGRSLPWFVAGTSILATTFSSDTPLVVAGISRETGIYGHWFWLAAAIGQCATVFFFARLWRRTEAMTDIQFVVLRYGSGKATSVLRVFKVLFDGVLVNCIVMASVTRAMAKIIKALLDLPDATILHVPVLGDVGWGDLLLGALGAAAVLYAALSGLYGVAYTDLVQFGLAMIGSVGLAIIVYLNASGGSGLLAKLGSAPGVSPNHLRFFPDLQFSDLATFTFFVYIFVIWWYRAPGNGYYVQRLLATRSERDSFRAFLWFNICQYVVRPWPWIIVGLLSLHYLPTLDDPESSFPMMINHFLPVGLKGIMVASLLAAFMSTIDTHLNWGTSYLVNDFYQAFVRRNASPRHYVFIARVVMLGLTTIALLLATRLTSILGAYKYLAVVFGGIGTVMIARWYWWRVNPYSEIAAIVTSLVVGNLVQIVLPSSPGADLFGFRVVVTVFLTTVVWVVVTLWTAPATPDDHTVRFYKKMQISGAGWRTVREWTGLPARTGEFKRSFVGWILCLVFIFSATLAIGKLLLLEFVSGLICGGLALASGLLFRAVLSKGNSLAGILRDGKESAMQSMSAREVKGSEESHAAGYAPVMGPLAPGGLQTNDAGTSKTVQSVPTAARFGAS